MANTGLEQVVGFHAFAEDLGYFRRSLKALWLGMRTAALRDFCFQTRLTNRLTYLYLLFLHGIGAYLYPGFGVL